MYYYLMNTQQRAELPDVMLVGEPLPNITKEFYIVEAIETGLNSEVEFFDEDDCSEFIQQNIQDWDDMFDTYEL